MEVALVPIRTPPTARCSFFLDGRSDIEKTRGANLWALNTCESFPTECGSAIKCNVKSCTCE